MRDCTVRNFVLQTVKRAISCTDTERGAKACIMALAGGEPADTDLGAKACIMAAFMLSSETRTTMGFTPSCY